MAFFDNLLRGILDFSWWHIALYVLVTTHVTIAAVTIYLHRHSAHRALTLHPCVAHFFRFWLWLTTGMVTREWTAVHRKHHARCETREDPHSPQIQGIWKVLGEGVELYRAAATDETLKRYGKDCPDDWIERHLYSKHTSLGVFSLLAIDLLAFGIIGATVWAIQMLWIPVLAAGVINGIGHFWGYRNFEPEDASKNILPWGILIGGEELHNNHHTYPNSAKLSRKPWEFDIGWAYIRILAACGLARVRSSGPVASRGNDRETIDMDMIRGVINNRFQVMARFADLVITPLVRSERAIADHATKRLLRPAKRLLRRDESLLDADPGNQRRVRRILAASERLRTIYDLRLGLQEIWSKRGSNTEEIMRAFKSWVERAEASGILAVQDFVLYLKSHTLPTKLGSPSN